LNGEPILGVSPLFKDNKRAPTSLQKIMRYEENKGGER